MEDESPSWVWSSVAVAATEPHGSPRGMMWPRGVVESPVGTSSVAAMEPQGSRRVTMKARGVVVLPVWTSSVLAREHSRRAQQAIARAPSCLHRRSGRCAACNDELLYGRADDDEEYGVTSTSSNLCGTVIGARRADGGVDTDGNEEGVDGDDDDEDDDDVSSTSVVDVHVIDDDDVIVID